MTASGGRSARREWDAKRWSITTSHLSGPKCRTFLASQNPPAGGDPELLVSTVCVHWALPLCHPTSARSGSLGMICRALQGSACPGGPTPLASHGRHAIGPGGQPHGCCLTRHTRHPPRAATEGSPSLCRGRPALGSLLQHTLPVASCR